MAIDSVSNLVEALRQSRLLEPAQQEEIDRQLQSRFTDPRVLARELIQRGWLTPYQVNQLMQGHGNELVLRTGGTEYKILERLGAGGMGQVFKARHSQLNKIVAIKVIRKEHLEKPDAVHRFKREIRAVSKLSHPNIVMALDADTAGDTHFYAMEFVDGTDLSRLVKEGGPLPIPVSIEYMKQAAQALQHASEQGLVHRDIKPANLLIARPSSRPTGFGQTPAIGMPAMGTAAFTSGAGTVKLLDLGLARVTGAADSQSLSWRTQDGKVVGTPDYMAPEQALKSSEADVRADLYSLGCTFYFALCGRVAFPGGTLMEKLLKHKMDTAAPIESLRPEVPKALGDILRKLMMKKPTDRFQTPGELVAALDALSAPAPRTVRVSQDVLQTAGITAIGASDATAEETKRASSGVPGGMIPPPLPMSILVLGILLFAVVVVVILM
jgi:serine/threonine-protein kinase